MFVDPIITSLRKLVNRKKQGQTEVCPCWVICYFFLLSAKADQDHEPPLLPLSTFQLVIV